MTVEDEYLDAFVRESDEAITALNNSLLELESDPDDAAALESVFRTAHTLKGNFGAMGFDDAAALAHAIEDLLDAVRQGELAVTPGVMDLVFAGVDTLEDVVDEVSDGGEPTVETETVVADLRAALDAGAAADAAADGERPAETPRTASGHPLGDGVRGPDPASADGTVVRAEVDLGDTDMAGVDALLALEKVEESATILSSSPDRDAIEGGEFDGSFVLFLDAPDVDAAASLLDDVREIAAFDATDATERMAASASLPGGEPTDEREAREITSVPVDVDRLDELHGLVEQLVTSRIKLRRAVETEDLLAAGETLNELDTIATSLQNTVMDVRLIPLRTVVGKFPRLVRDLARELGKEVEFTVEGADIELDRTILTEISDPLLHVLRNAIDHGIEPPDEREAAGKPRAGQVELRASRERDHVVVEVADDGAGLDVERIEETAVERSVRSREELAVMDDSAVYDLIFHPGFSTADEVTGTSGRGVGLDVVHDTVSRLDGSVTVESTPGEGTTVSLRLPVTMAIVKVLFVAVGDERYGIPLKHVEEITRADEVERVNGAPVVRRSDGLSPVVDLGETFDVSGASADGDGRLVHVRETERRIALRCDAVEDQEEVVVKPLEGLVSETPGISGTAVLGDGDIVHIVDLVTL